MIVGWKRTLKWPRFFLTGNIIFVSIYIPLFWGLGESGVISTTREIRPVDCLSLININYSREATHRFVPPTMQSQIPKSRDVTLFFLDMTLYK